MKRGAKSLLLIAILAAMLGGYSLVGALDRKAQVAEEAGSFALTQRGAEELTGMKWTSDGEEYHFVRGEDGWSNADDDAFPTDQQAVQDMADRLMQLSASRRLSDVESMADYGFDESSYAVTAEWADGESSIYRMGDETPFGDGWYIRIEGEDGVVYSCASSLEDMFAESALELAQQEEIGSVESAAELSIGGELQLVQKEQSLGIDPDQRWYSADGEPMDDDEVASLIEKIKALNWSALIAVNAGEDELAEYGLGDGSATELRLIGDDGAGIDLLIGASDASGTYYARLPGSAMVYSLPGEDVEDILAASLSSLRNLKLYPLEYGEVAHFSCTLDGSELSYEIIEAGDENDDEVEAEESAATQELWSLIGGLSATNVSDAAPKGDALVQIDVTNAEGARMDCSFYACDVDSYLAVTGDGRSLLVPADAVDKLIRTLRQAL